jgi:hypothetical protein
MIMRVAEQVLDRHGGGKYAWPDTAAAHEWI